MTPSPPVLQNIINHMSLPMATMTVHHSKMLIPTDLYDFLQHPTVVATVALIAAALIYQSLHSDNPLAHTRHPGELLWDFIIAVTPARLIYALDQCLHPPLFPVPDSMRPPIPTTYQAKSQLLRHLLGMDNPNSIVNAVAQKGLSTLSSSPFAKRQLDQPAGLGNHNNSCFQNSILQGLSSLKPLPAYLTTALAYSVPTTADKDEASAAATLRELLFKLTHAEHNGKTLWTPARLKSLDTWQQQDAQEYYSKILDEIDKEVMIAAKTQQPICGLELASSEDDTVESQHSDDSGYQSQTSLAKASIESRAPKNPLEGLVAQRVACVQCGHSEGLSMIPFNCITLSLGLGGAPHDLFERLDSYTDLESIEGVECAKCSLLRVQGLLKKVLSKSREMGKSEESLEEPSSRLNAIELALEEDDFADETLLEKCKITKPLRVSSTKTKQMVIARPPQSLAIHINRSVFDESTGVLYKNPAAVRFPSTLDLGPWCLGSAGPARSASSASSDIQTEEQWSSDPRSSMVSGDLRPSQISGPIYELRAVVTHTGRHDNGHYVCYRKHPNHGAETSPISEEKSKSTASDELDADEESKWWRISDENVWEVTEDLVLAEGGVFMLFYDCIDPQSVLRSQSEESIVSIESRQTHILPMAQGPQTSASDDRHSTEAALEVLRERVSQKPANLLTSCLFPSLKENESVDPAIPLGRPNS
ncbi:cysteine proteinase [Xylariaceae sp. FL0255]|nr:cysteine proteinase [Xylariaceae sp. FL0255]